MDENVHDIGDNLKICFDLLDIQKFEEAQSYLKNGLSQCSSITETWLVKNFQLYATFKLCATRGFSCAKIEEMCLERTAEQLLLKEQGVPVAEDNLPLEVLTATNYLVLQLLKASNIRKGSCAFHGYEMVAWSCSRVLAWLKMLKQEVLSPYQRDSRKGKEDVLELILEILLHFAKVTHTSSTSIKVLYYCILRFVSMVLLMLTFDKSTDDGSCYGTKLLKATEACVEATKSDQCKVGDSFNLLVSPFMLDMDPLNLQEVAEITSIIAAMIEKETEGFFIWSKPSSGESLCSESLKDLVIGYHYLREQANEDAGHKFVKCCKSAKLLGMDRVVALARNGIGSCLLKSAKPALALQMFKMANLAWDGNRAAQLNIVTCLHQLGQSKAKTDSLVLLLKLAKLDTDFPTKEACFSGAHISDVLVAFISKAILPILEDEKLDDTSCAYYCDKLDEASLLYDLGTTLFSSERYEESSDTFLDLLGLVSLGRLPKVCINNKWKVSELYYQCIRALLFAGKYKTALKICDHLLDGALPTKAAIRKAHGQHGKEEKILVNLPYDVIAAILKAEVLRKTGKLKEALSLLERVRESTEAVDFDESFTPPSKRMKFKGSDVCIDLCSIQMQLLNNLGVLYIDLERKSDAFKMFAEGIKRCRDAIPDELRVNFCKCIYLEKGKDLAWKNWNSGFQSSCSMKQFDEILSKTFQTIFNAEYEKIDA